jgi:ribose-phosphate pyrophosphokinase
VAPALINNCINVSPLRFIKNAILDFDPDVLIAPDAGAAKKIKAYNIDLPIEYCGKTRNMETGQLTDFQLYCDTFYERPLIIDDICDGGGTFLALAPIIKGKTACEAIGLYVTHGLFTKGVEVITDVFDKVYCTNSYKGNLIDHDKLTVYGI